MSSKNEIVIDVKLAGEKTSTKEMVDFATDVVVDSAFGVLNGAVGTAGDIGASCIRLFSGDVKGASEILKTRADGVITGVIETAKSGVAVCEASYKSLAHDEDFFTQENKTHLTRLCQLGIYSAATGAVLDQDTVEGSACNLPDDACQLPGVENGVFVGDSSDLNNLIQQGEVEGTTHLTTEDIDRDPVARAEFLNAHNIEDLDGNQVHHIVPLSEGGADHPNNMVVINPDDHAKITAAHAEFYAWHDSDKTA